MQVEIIIKDDNGIEKLRKSLMGYEINISEDAGINRIWMSGSDKPSMFYSGEYRFSLQAWKGSDSYASFVGVRDINCIPLATQASKEELDQSPIAQALISQAAIAEEKMPIDELEDHTSAYGQLKRLRLALIGPDKSIGVAPVQIVDAALEVLQQSKSKMS